VRFPKKLYKGKKIVTMHPRCTVTFLGRTAAGSCRPENNRRAVAGARRAEQPIIRTV